MHTAKANIAINSFITTISSELYFKIQKLNTFGQYHFRVRKITNF
jgi:hypothetical protein